MKKDIVESSFIFSMYREVDLFHDYMDKVDAINFFEKEESIFYYTLGRELVKQGYKSIDQLAVATYLLDKPALNSYYEELGGWKTIKDITNIVNESNIEKYYDELVKNNVIKTLKSKGFVIDEAKFNGCTSQEVYAYYEFILNSAFVHNDMDIKIDKFNIDDAYLKRKDDGIALGASIGSTLPRLNYDISGLHSGNLSILASYSGNGKAQPLDSNILTETGYKKMGEIRVGDKVYGEDGKLHSIIGVYPQGIKEVYKVKFSDGSFTECCKEHLWDIQLAKSRGYKPNYYETKSLEEIMGIPKYNVDKKTGFKKKNIFIPMTKPIEIEYKETPLDPYLLGLLLGDGGFAGGQIEFTNSEKDIWDYVESNLPESVKSKFSGSSGITKRFTDYSKNKTNILTDIIGNLGLKGKHSNDKFIPDIYKFNSIKVRKDILSGLIDTDGEVVGSNYIFSSTSIQLCEDVKFLVQSLGGTAKISIRQTYFTYKNEKKKGKISYRVFIKMPIGLEIFKSEKHRNKFKIGQTKARRAIVDIELVGKKECQCIMVDSPTHLYLTDDCIVTHNTAICIHSVVLPLLEQGYKYTIISNEQVLDEFRDNIICLVMAKKFNYWGITRKRLQAGKFTEEEWKHLTMAKDYINSNYADKLNFVKMFEYNVSSTKKIIKKLANEGCKYFLYDTFKAEDASDSNVAGLMVEYSKELFQLASKMDIHILITQQLATYTENQRYLTRACLSNSKQVAEVADVIILMRHIWDDEFEGEQYDITPYNFMKDSNGNYVRDDKKTVKELVNLDRDERNIIIFLDKNRWGEDKKTYVCKFNGRYNIWNELGYCHVSTKNRY